MKKRLSVFLIWLIASAAFAQNDSLIEGIVSYKHKFFQIDGSEDYYISKVMFNANESLGISHKFGMEEDKGDRLNYENGAVQMVQSAHDHKGTMFYRNIATRQFLFRFKANKPFPAYVVNDTWIDINWVLKDEYKTILDYRVQKAVGEFRGRTWTVWFSETIPVAFGPVKLHGLPGIIMEAKTGDFHITATNVCYPCKTDVIEMPDEELKWSVKEYMHIWDNYAIYTVLENNKLGIRGLFLSEAPTEASIWANRKKRMDLEYEWEDKKTKRAIYDKKVLEEVLIPKEEKQTNIPPPEAIKL